MNKLLSVLVAGALAAAVAPAAIAADQSANQGSGVKGAYEKSKSAVKRQWEKAKDFNARNQAVGGANPRVGERPTYPASANTRTEMNSASARADNPAAASAAAGTGAGAMSGMGSGSSRASSGTSSDTMSSSDRYASDRERTRERAMRWAEQRNQGR